MRNYEIQKEDKITVVDCDRNCVSSTRVTTQFLTQSFIESILESLKERHVYTTVFHRFYESRLLKFEVSVTYDS